MEVLASANLAAQIGVIWFAKNRTANPSHRRILLTVAAASIAVMAAAVAVQLLLNQSGGAELELAGVAMWLLYIAIGAAVVAGVVAAMRQPGAMRFAWRQGRYAKYRSYRRI